LHADGLFLSDSCAKSKQIIFEFGKRCNKDWDNKPGIDIIGFKQTQGASQYLALMQNIANAFEKCLK
jgi:hypothetical protein